MNPLVIATLSNLSKSADGKGATFGKHGMKLKFKDGFGLERSIDLPEDFRNELVKEYSSNGSFNLPEGYDKSEAVFSIPVNDDDERFAKYLRPSILSSLRGWSRSELNPNATVYDSSEHFLKYVDKNGKERVIPLDPSLAEELERELIEDTDFEPPTELPKDEVTVEREVSDDDDRIYNDAIMKSLLGGDY